MYLNFKAIEEPKIFSNFSEKCVPQFKKGMDTIFFLKNVSNFVSTPFMHDELTRC